MSYSLIKFRLKGVCLAGTGGPGGTFAYCIRLAIEARPSCAPSAVLVQFCFTEIIIELPSRRQ